MNKLTPKTVVRVAVHYEVLLDNGDTDNMSVSQDITLQELIAMGHFLQKDLLDELKSTLEEAFEIKDEAIAILDEYTVAGIISYGNDSNQFYLDELYLEGNEFIPEFRGLHGITY